MTRPLTTDRRGFLQVGALGTLGLGLADVLRLQSWASAATRSAKTPTSVIILFMRGGPPQTDTWDMKPDAPDGVRGEFAPTATTVPGVQISEHLPKSAAIMDQWSIVRSLHHRPEDGDVSHSRGAQVMFTGHSPNPLDPQTNLHPSVGSVTARQLQGANSELPAYVMVPRVIPGTATGYLGRAFRPVRDARRPGQPGAVSVPDLTPPDGLGADP